MSTVRIDATHNGGTITVDGHDVSNAVRGYTVSQRAGGRADVLLDLVVVDLTADVEKANVHINQYAADLLMLAGWTPPPGRPATLLVLPNTDTEGADRG